MDDLHDALLLEILIHLPEKSLGRFKCINKRYNHLISSPFFQTMQAQKSIDNVLGLFHVTRHSEGGRALYFPLDDNPDNLVKLSFSADPNPFRPNVSIIGSCNGLLLGEFPDSRKLFVWNPKTKKHQVLPDIGFRYGCGLAVDLVTDEYKVVCISGIRWGKYRFKVYSSRTDGCSLSETKLSYGGDSWLLPSFAPFYFKGAVHWMRDRGDIIAFDVKSEGVREIQLPAEAGFSSRKEYLNKMWVGSVGCFINIVEIINDQVNIWVLGDYEKVKWRMKREIKMGVTDPPRIIGITRRISDDEIMLFFDGERIVTGLFGPNTAIYIYNIRKNATKISSLPGWVDHCRCFFPYISNTVNLLN